MESDVGAGSALRLDGDLSVREAANLRTKLLTQLETGAPILIDARQVTAMDAGIAQLLISARASAVRMSLDFTLIGNEVVSETLCQLGIAPMTTEAA